MVQNFLTMFFPGAIFSCVDWACSDGISSNKKIHTLGSTYLRDD